MAVASKHPKEEQRLESLRMLEILDTLPEKDFDDITLIAAQICQTPIALLSLIDTDRQWFKSKIGIEGNHFMRKLAKQGLAPWSDLKHIVDRPKYRRF